MSARYATVAVCTYNGAKRIVRVIEALARQTLPYQQWELIVVNNGSTDKTADVVAQLLRKHRFSSARCVTESRIGLSSARARAVRESNGEVVCFLDDDNVPEVTFLAAAIDGFSAVPRAGIIGGRVVAQWDVQPSRLALAVQDFALAICDRGDRPLRLDAQGEGLVGAGLCGRRELLSGLFESTGLAKAVRDRSGSKLSSGGDIALSVLARMRGWETWYLPTLRLAHCLPEARMDKRYLLELYDGIGRGQFAVRRLYDWKVRTPLAWVVGVKDLARALYARAHKPSAGGSGAQDSVAADVHDLETQLIIGRARQALTWPF